MYVIANLSTTDVRATENEKFYIVLIVLIQGKYTYLDRKFVKRPCKTNRLPTFLHVQRIKVEKFGALLLVLLFDSIKQIDKSVLDLQCRCCVFCDR